MLAARAADSVLTIDPPIHYFTVIVPYVEPKRATAYHPTVATGPLSRLSRGAFPSLDAACTWAKDHLAGTPYGVTEVGWSEELGDWSRVTIAIPVCPRCLDLTPGEAGGDPAAPHPGPFTEALCAACSRVVEIDLRAEGRTEAANYEATQRNAAAPSTISCGCGVPAFIHPEATSPFGSCGTCGLPLLPR